MAMITVSTTRIAGIAEYQQIILIQKSGQRRRGTGEFKMCEICGYISRREQQLISGIKLKRCPHCGGEAKMIGSYPNCFVECQRCRSSSDMAISPEKAAKAWNRRARDERD